MVFFILYSLNGLVDSKEIEKYHSINYFRSSVQKRESFRQFVNELFTYLLKMFQNDHSTPEENPNPVELNVTPGSKTRSSSKLKRKLWEIEKNKWNTGSL